MSDISAKIKEVLEHGSVFTALEQEYVQPLDVLNALESYYPQPGMQELIAYKAVCMKLHPNQHVMPHGKHFLAVAPDYALVAIGYGLDLNTRVDDLTLQDVLPSQLPQTSWAKETAVFVLSGQNQIANILQQWYKNDIKQYYISARHWSPWLNINMLALNADWMCKLQYNCNLPLQLLQRAQYMREVAPYYYEHVLTPLYTDVVRRIVNMRLFSKMSIDDFAALHELFPNLVDIRYSQLNDYAFDIATLSLDVAAYYLGFPIDHYLPDENQVLMAAAILGEEGPEQYLKRLHDSPSSFLNLPDPIVANDEDVMMERIEDYLPFDIVSYRKGQYLYRFTRPEFENLLKTGVNHWTNELLPLSILSVIASRVQTAVEIGLDQRLPYVNLVEDLTAVDDYDDMPLLLEEDDEDMPSLLEDLDSDSDLGLSDGIYERLMHVQDRLSQLRPHEIMSHVTSQDVQSRANMLIEEDIALFRQIVEDNLSGRLNTNQILSSLNDRMVAYLESLASIGQDHASEDEEVIIYDSEDSYESVFDDEQDGAYILPPDQRPTVWYSPESLYPTIMNSFNLGPRVPFED